MREITKDDFFFCYTKILSIYLKKEGISYLLKANSVKDGNTFTLYAKTDELQEALDKYKANNWR